MSDKGRALFLEALNHRYHVRYEKANIAFEEAAKAGNGDACWHLYCNYEWGTYPHIDKPDGFQHREFLLTGAKLGNPMCIARLYAETGVTGAVLDRIIASSDWRKEIPTYPSSLEAELIYYDAWPDLSPRVFEPSEIENLRNGAQRAVLIHDPWPLSCYFRYLTKHFELLQLADPSLIAEAILINEADEAYIVQYEEPTGRGFRSFDFDHVIVRNELGLSPQLQKMVVAAFGKITEHIWFRAVPNDEEVAICVRFYQMVRKVAQNATVAWLGCFKRGAISYLNRDTATLIGKIIYDPIQWSATEIEPGGGGSDLKKKKVNP